MPTEPRTKKIRSIISAESDLYKLAMATYWLLAKDSYLLDKDSSERSITHKLAQYIEIIYAGYDVDCEYNLNAISSNGKKMIHVLREKHKQAFDNSDLEDTREYDDTGVFPDIIIHKRGDNASNLAIIEVKKSGSRKRKIGYDRDKLKCYTDSSCEFMYPVGYLVTLPIRKNSNKRFKVEKFAEGKREYSVTIYPNFIQDMD